MRKTEYRHREHRSVLKGGKRKKKRYLFFFTALLPLILSVVWLIVLMLPAKIAGGVALSPARSTPLIIGLVIFIIGYVAFLSMMFSEDIKEWYEHLTKHKAH